ncbi:MAG: cytochrome-c peroxidase [Gemmatimonadaceae bacterium]
MTFRRRALIALALAAVACSARREAIVDQRPAHLVRPPVAPLSAMALLGRAIFYDSSLSASGRRSCASCHLADRAYGPGDRSTMVENGGVVRAVPSLRYAYRAPAFGVGPELSDVDEPVRVAPPDSSVHGVKIAGAPRTGAMVAHGGLFWDGRVNTLQDQAMGPLLNPNEMGNRDIPSVSEKLRRSPYASRFVALFGAGVLNEPSRLVDEAMFAVARYQIEDSTFHPYDSKYDAYLEGRAALTEQERRGLQAFEDPKRGNCAACHLDRPLGDGLPPVFTDYEYEALGVPTDTTRGRSADLGACGPIRTDLASRTAYCGVFRTPSLRNVATRVAFFHNGVYSTLEQVLAFYDFRATRPERIYSARSPLDSANLDTVDAPFNRRRGDVPPMTEQEMRDIIAFLKTLSDGPRP